MKNPTDLSKWIEAEIQKFMEESPENNLGGDFREKAWEKPLIGFSSGGDAIYEEYKEHVGPFHWTPLEIFTMAYPGLAVKPDELTVISWVLPQTLATREENRKQTFYPSERWARARIFGEEVNVKLHKYVTAFLREEGYMAVAPTLEPQWERKTSEKYSFASTWSHRHAAYAAGLGTFGLCDGLITSRGKAMRVGSVIIKAQIPPTPRLYTDHNEYCLFFSHGTCGKCIPRCPVGAITENGHDKLKCRDHLRPVTSDYVKSNYGFEGYGCGLCQTGVPCESKIPTEQDG